MAENKPFVITIVGAESSGKTTLAMQLAEELKCPWVPEYAREYLEQLGRDYDEKDLLVIAEGQLKMINSVITQDSTFVSRQSSVVSRESSFAPYPLMLRPALTHPLATAQQPGEWNDIIEIIKSKIQNPMLRPALTHPLATAQQPSKFVIVDGGMMNLRMWGRIKFKMTIPVVEEALQNDVTDLYLLRKPRKEWTPDPLREAPTLLERAWIYNQYLAELLKGKVQMEIITVK